MMPKLLPPWLRELSETQQVRQEVLEAMDLPRELFVPESVSDSFRGDILTSVALPIGMGQTISQPSTVAKMTEAVISCSPKKVLEIGTGSGFQTAVLCRLVENVFTIERITNIQLDSIRRLYKLGIYNFKAIAGDGYEGWPSQAPFDAIMVTAAAPAIPQKLLEQLAEGGVLVMPVGATDSPDSQQELIVAKKTESKIVTSKLGLVNFVPLVPGIQSN